MKQHFTIFLHFCLFKYHVKKNKSLPCHITFTRDFCWFRVGEKYPWKKVGLTFCSWFSFVGVIFIIYCLTFIKGKPHSNHIFLYFVLICSEWDFINLFTKMNFFASSKTHISAPLTQDIYMTFYLLTWTYFNDVNGGRNILINSQPKMSSDKKNWKKLRKTEKTWKKKITAMKVRLQWKWDTRFKFFETFWIWTKNKHRRY